MILAHVMTGPDRLWDSWAIEPVPLVMLSALSLLFVVGWVRLRARTPHAAARHLALWLMGALTSAGALSGPLDAAAHDLFSAHMVQHMVLVVVAAPALIASRPVRYLGHAVPPPARRWAGRTTHRVVGRSWRSPLVVGIATVATFVIWHVPALYEAAVRSDPVHALEHGSFLAVALGSWGLILGRQPAGTRAALAFAIFLVGGALGALLTFSGSVLYPVHGSGPVLWGLDPLSDQRLAGVIMWIPSGTVYVIAFCVLFLTWMRALDARMPARPRSAEGSPDG